MAAPDDLSCCRTTLLKWTRQWGVPHLAEQINCEWSSRLRRSLGRAYPKRKLIRLSLLLKEAPYEGLFEEVLCHEAAHVAVSQLHGNSAASHGSEWKELVLSAGHKPRTFHVAVGNLASSRSQLVCYQHTCPVCQTSRAAKSPQPGWRCVECQRAGLDGKLVIRSQPMKKGGIDG